MNHCLTTPIYHKRFVLGLLLIVHTFNTGAQNTSSVKKSKTDNIFANTTEIHKKETASDEQILTEIANDYGLGDVVRITIAPPTPPSADILPNPAFKTAEIQHDKSNLSSSLIQKEGNSRGFSPENVLPTEGGQQAYNFNLNENNSEKAVDLTLNNREEKQKNVVAIPQALPSKTKLSNGNIAKSSHISRNLYIKKSKNPFRLFSFKKKNRKNMRYHPKQKSNRQYGCYKF